jgi:transposase
MAELYSVELRERVVGAYEAGEGSHAEIGDRFALGEATVKRWVRLKRTKGDVSPQSKRGGTPSEIGGEQIATMLARLETRPPSSSRLNSIGDVAGRNAFTCRA